MGYKVLVARDGDDSNYTELYHAPSLMGFQIKTLSVGPDSTLKIEPTKIVPGNPPASERVPERTRLTLLTNIV